MIKSTIQPDNLPDTYDFFNIEINIEGLCDAIQKHEHSP